MAEKAPTKKAAPKKTAPTKSDKDTPSTEDEKDLAAENEQLKAQLADAEARLAQETISPADELLIKAKIGAGLSREQAVAVVKAQKAHDLALEDAA